MDLRFRPFSYASVDDSIHLARWYADPAIRHLLIPIRDESHSSAPEIASEIYSRLKAARHRPFVDWLILDGDRPIGHCDLYFDMPHRLTREGRVAWLGIVIGEAEYRGRGIGLQVLERLEAVAREVGATAIEAGVFEFNDVSLRLFRRAGYREIARVPDLTWWKGRKWDDVRFLKELGESGNWS